MNNWRLLLLAVVAVLQPIGSFTESNLIDGRQECCDHRSNSFAQETRLYGNSRKTTPEDRRLNSAKIREAQRLSEAQNDHIRFRERLAVENTERRVSPESAVRFNTETRFVRDQERRQRSIDAREPRQTREDQSRRIRERLSRDSLNRYERDALDSRRIRISRDDTTVRRVNNERVYRESFEADTARRVRDSGHIRRVSVIRETMADRRGNDDVILDESRRDTKIGTFRAENRLQNNNNKERRAMDHRVMENTEENRRTQSESRINSERENRRTSARIISERVDERNQRDHNRESRDKRIDTLRDSSERIFTVGRREPHDATERVDQSRKIIREYRTNDRIEFQRQHRDESRPSRERSLERRESRLNVERSQPLSRESRLLDTKERSNRIVRSDDRTNARREATRDMLHASQDSTFERRQNSRSRISESTTIVFRNLRSNDARHERRQLSTRSLDRVRSDEREVIARIPERNVRDVRNVRSIERLDERREQQYGAHMSKDGRITMNRESRDSVERRQEKRSTVSPSRLEVNARSERESRLRVQDNVRSNNRDREEYTASRKQTINRMARDTERRHDERMSRTSRFAERANPEERVSRIRDDTKTDRVGRREASDGNNVRTVVIERPTRDVSALQRRFETRMSRIESNNPFQRARTLEDIRDERREVRERDESRASRERISMTRLSRQKSERREARENIRNSQLDARNDIRNRGIRLTEKFKSRRTTDESRFQDRVLEHQVRDVVKMRSAERRSRETASRGTRSEQLSRSRDVKKINGDVRNDARVIRTIESRRESKRMTEREVQHNRENSAMERIDRTTNRDIRMEAKFRSSDVVLVKDIRADIRHDARDTRFRHFEAKLRELDPIDSDNQNAMSWQMVFYTLQGAYLCGLLMQMLTEKSNKGKSRNITVWWSASKDLVKVD